MCASLADLRRKSLKNHVSNVIEKSKKLNKGRSTTKKGTDSYTRLKNLCEMVEQKLAHLKDNFECITDENRLKEYIDKAIENGYISIDTETTGLDPITDEIVGGCIYTPGEKAAYIPINHISAITRTRLQNQLTNEQVGNQFKRLKENNTKIIYFNAKFDIRVMRHQLGVDLPCYWDGFIAGKVLKENEEESNLKYLWKKYCSPNKDAPHFTFDKLFKDVKFNLVPMKTATLYAANDAIITWELYKFQEQYLDENSKLCQDCGFTKLAKLYKEIELPIIPIIADIEDNGISLDLEYSEKLSIKYHKLLDESLAKFQDTLSNYEDKIQQYRNTHPYTKLGNPINIASPTQLAELFYDVLGVESVSRKQPRGTGSDILEKINHPLCANILEYRGYAKLLSTYIDKMPAILNSKTHKIHCNFHQYGADTGRFSSSDPNMQNIPSHNKDIRRMFTGSSHYVLIGSDFSQQEPKLTADMSNDEQFIKDCASGKDAYATIASIAFEKPYEECLEFRPDGTVNPEGKERRSQAKIILLGICYGKTMQSIAIDLGVSEEKATEIYNAVLSNIPGLRHFMEESQDMARTTGWVETKWGRRRHIPEMLLQPFEVTYEGTKNFDPFFDSRELGVIDETEKLKLHYIEEMSKAKFHKQKQNIKLKAEKDGFKIKDNTRIIDEATRQCVNCVDDKTEILTNNGWKNVYQLTLQDKVLSVNPDTQLYEWDNLLKINKYEGNFDMIKFEHNSFSALTTNNHRWLCINKRKKENYIYKTSEEISRCCGDNWANYHIIKVANNNFKEGPYQDWFLQLVGYFLTDGSLGSQSPNSIKLYQSYSANPEKCKRIEKTLQDGNVHFHKRIKENGYCTWGINFELGRKIRDMFPDRELTIQFILSLSQRQANIVVEAMLLGDGSKSKFDTKLIVSNMNKVNMFQMLLQIAGIASNYKVHDHIGMEHHSDKLKNVIVTKNLYYTVRLLNRKRIHIYKKHITQEKSNFVWCPTTGNGNWVARRNGETYITGNSRVQGSAADQTKIAIRLIGTNQRLKELGWRTLILVHDEIIGECPVENVKECRDLLIKCMLDSAKDLRTGAKCDPSVVKCWYGEEIDVDHLTVEEIKEKYNI